MKKPRKPRKREPIDVAIPAEAWEPVGGASGGKPTRLVATVYFNGTGHHLDAFEVKRPDDVGHQVLADKGDEEAFGQWIAASGPDGPFETVEIGKRSYVIFASPFC